MKSDMYNKKDMEFITSEYPKDKEYEGKKVKIKFNEYCENEIYFTYRNKQICDSLLRNLEFVYIENIYHDNEFYLCFGREMHDQIKIKIHNVNSVLNFLHTSKNCKKIDLLNLKIDGDYIYYYEFSHISDYIDTAIEYKKELI